MVEYIIIGILIIVAIIFLKYLFGYNKKQLKQLADEKELDEIAKKYPSNTELCKTYLKMLKNETVEIEEDEKSESSLYIAATNKIVIANISKTYTRIQTIAHECLHSVQDRKLLLFNFIYANIYFICFAIMCILIAFKIIPYKSLLLIIFLILSSIFYAVRAYLENDAMIKARFLAKEYLDQAKISSEEEIEKLVNGFDKINAVGIKCTNYYLLFLTLMLTLILVIFCMIR